MRSMNHRREGFALAVAIAAIVVIGALIAGVYFTSTQEFRIGRNTLLQTRALTAAELGLNAMTTPVPNGQWNPGVYNALASGATAPPVQVLPGDGSVDTVRVTKLNDMTFLAVSEGRAGNSQAAEARRRLAVLLTLQIPQINMLAALVTRGNTHIGGSSFINGNDTSFTGWGCPPAGPAKPGIAISDPALITTSGCTGLSCVTGSPPVSTDPAAADTNTYFKFGDTDWQRLTAMATKIASGNYTGLAPSFNADNTCNMNDPNNWGDPQHVLGNAACQQYWPIVYAPGNIKINGGDGQGILLVEGDLEVMGGAEFFGPVIVRGRLKTTGTGGHFNGGVMAANVSLDQNTVLGDAVIRYSSCAINKALAGSSLPVFARGRSWVELY
ncbi:MAG TPA: hypothetical protein VJ672_16315 [Gemmatimonadaceae bacterium]|nr:hypothetical protein [Gemmatimonadaceae bacterium]